MRKFKTFLLVAAVPSATLVASPAMAEPYLQISTGVDYSSGDYGDTVNTDYLAVPVAVKYQAENFYVRASTSWANVKGPSGFIPGDGGVTTGNAGGQVVSRSGLGDVFRCGWKGEIADGLRKQIPRHRQHRFYRARRNFT